MRVLANETSALAVIRPERGYSLEFQKESDVIECVLRCRCHQRVGFQFGQPLEYRLQVQLTMNSCEMTETERGDPSYISVAMAGEAHALCLHPLPIWIVVGCTEKRIRDVGGIAAAKKSFNL